MNRDRALANDAIAPFWMLAALTFVLWPFVTGSAALAAGWERAALQLVLLAAVLYGALRATGAVPPAALLAAVVCALALPTLLAAVIAPDAHLLPGRGLVPGQWISTLLHDAVADPRWPLVHSDRNLVAQWLGRPSEAGEERRFLLENGLYLGMLPVWLGLLGMFTARGVLAWVARAVLLAGVALASGAVAPSGRAAWLVDVSPCLVAAATAGLAGLALAALVAEGPAPARAAPSITLGVGAVVLTVALGIAALQAGFAPDVALMERVGRLLGAGVDGPLDALVARRNALHVRDVLDRAALASFASMCALLVFLRGRGLVAALLVVAVATADLALVGAAWLGH